MRIVEKSQYKALLEKGHQHLGAGDWAFKEKTYDAAITNYSIAVINYLDALSVSRFGKDLSSDNHEAAPTVLQNRLSGVGVSDFKNLSIDCVEVLKMKNVASYRSEPLTATQAKRAQEVAKKAKGYVERRIATA